VRLNHRAGPIASQQDCLFPPATAYNVNVESTRTEKPPSEHGLSTSIGSTSLATPTTQPPTTRPSVGANEVAPQIMRCRLVKLR
jgi:hypothetical protein